MPSTPKKWTWIIGLIAGIAGIVAHYLHTTIPVLTEYNYLLLVAGFVLLALGTSFKNF